MSLNLLKCSTLESRVAREIDLHILRSGGGYLLKPHRAKLIARRLQQIRARQATETANFDSETDEEVTTQ